MRVDKFGDRMKKHEDKYRAYIDNNLPIIIRLDGCHFSQYTKNCEKPYDQRIVDLMNSSAIELCEQIQNVRMAYIQSDEISILLTKKNDKSESWFGGNIQKMASVSASICSSTFSNNSISILGNYKPAYFDSRVFNLPVEEVNNYFWWREKDNIKNSIASHTRTIFSNKEMKDKHSEELKQMCAEAGKPWEDTPIHFQRGRAVIKRSYEKTEFIEKLNKEITCIRNEWVIDNDLPLFKDDKFYVESRI